MSKSETLRIRMEPEELEWLRTAAAARGITPSALAREQLEPVITDAKIASIASEFTDIEGVILFGSMARGAYTPDSDVDLLVKTTRSRSWMADGGLGSFKARIEDAVQRAVDIVTPRSCSPELARTIAKEGRVVYAR